MRLVRASLLLTTAALCGPAPAWTQESHFDMSPEIDLRRPEVIEAPSSLLPDEEAVYVPDAISHVITADALRLQGETPSQTYQVYLSATQAQSAAVFQLAYLNALVVAPENSRLRVSVNGTTILNTPIASSASSQVLAVDVPAGVLQTGPNRVTISADQRHRTDCDIDSTYALWTDIDASQTFFGFTGERTAQLTRLDEIAAVGVDGEGQTRINLIAPDPMSTELGQSALALVQALALDLRVPNAEVVLGTEPVAAGPGVLNVVLGTAGALPDYVGTLAQEAQRTGVAAFVGGAQNLLVVSGADWAQVGEAIGSVGQIHAQYGTPAGHLPERADRPRAVPVLESGGAITLEDAGIETTNFNGRRMTRSFSFALPSDFYANNYGEAELLLNAAFSQDVRPGSQIDVYVNGQIASVSPILRTSDSLREKLIKVPMTSFRPGINTVEVVAAVLTQADAVCAPGTVTVGTDSRLLLSSDSTFSMPNFARVSQSPDLASFASDAYPYASKDNTRLVVGPGEDGLAAGLTFAARLASNAGHVVAYDGVGLASPSPQEPAIFVGSYEALPPDSLERLGILEPYAGGDLDAQDTAVDIGTILQRWRSQGSSGANTILARVRHWIADLLDLGPNSLGILPPPDTAYPPSSSDQGVLVQALQPEGGLWTMAMVPNPDDLDTGLDALMRSDNWQKIEGRVSALGADGSSMNTVAANRVVLSQSTPLNLTNIRLIAANWLSSHVLAYALGLGLLTILLTISTARVLRTFGRQSE